MRRRKKRKKFNLKIFGKIQKKFDNRFKPKREFVFCAPIQVGEKKKIMILEEG